MAKFSEQLSQTDVKPRVFSHPVDKSEATTIEAMGNAVVEGIRGHQLNQLEGNVNEAIDEFYQSNSAEGAADRASAMEDATVGVEESGAELRTESLMGEEAAELGLAPTEALPAAAMQYAKSMNTLKTAQSQGRITTDQLKVKVEALTRQAITSMPGMAGDFRTLGAQTLGDHSSAIGVFESNEKAAAKQAADRSKAIQKMWVEGGGEPWKDATAPENMARLQTIHLIAADAQTAALQAQVLKDRGVIKKDLYSNHLSAFGKAHMIGVDNAFMRWLGTSAGGKRMFPEGAPQYITDLQALQPTSHAEIGKLYGMFLNEHNADFLGLVRNLSSEFSTSDTDPYTQTDGLKSSFMDMITGKTAAESYGHMATMNEKATLVGMYNTPEGALLMNTINIVQNLPAGTMTETMRGKIAQMFTDAVGAEAFKAASSGSMRITAANGRSPLVVRTTEGIVALATAASAPEAPDLPQENVDQIVTALTTIAEGEPHSAIKQIDALAKALATEGVMSKLILKSNGGKELTEKGKKALTNVIKRTVKDFTAKMDSAFSGTDAGMLRITMDKSTGFISFKAVEGLETSLQREANAKATQYNNMYANRYGNYVTALARLETPTGKVNAAALKAQSENLIRTGMLDGMQARSLDEPAISFINALGELTYISPFLREVAKLGNATLQLNQAAGEAVVGGVKKVGEKVVESAEGSKREPSSAKHSYSANPADQAKSARPVIRYGIGTTGGFGVKQ